jgi:MFS family permease
LLNTALEPVAPGERESGARNPSRDAPVRRVFHGWVMVMALGVTATVSYGILAYAFPVFLAPMEAELGWSRVQVTGAYSLASLIAGVAAIPVGRRVDAHGARGVMTAGSVLASLLLLAWARVETLAGFYLIWAGLGAASAAVFYEPAFVVITHWFDRYRARALTLLTFMGGFASVIFVPLATGLVEANGWRTALVWLAAILAVLTVPLHALLLRRHPEDHGLLPDGASPDMDSIPAGERASSGTDVRGAVRSPAFLWLGTAFALSALATTGAVVHLVPLLLERGYSPRFAGAAMGTLGLMALPGRLLFTPLGGRFSRTRVTAAIFLLQLIGVVVLLVSTRDAAVWIFVVLFGAGFGAITPARAALVAEFFGRRACGSIGGVMASALALFRAAAPVGASVLYSIAGGYTVVLATLGAVCLGSALAVLRAGLTPMPVDAA